MDIIRCGFGGLGGLGSVTPGKGMQQRAARLTGETQQTFDELIKDAEAAKTQAAPEAEAAAETQAAPAGTDSARQNVDYSAVLAETLEKQLTEAVLTELRPESAGSYSGYQSFSGGGIESTVLAAAATGQVTDAQIALMMLCMMMQSSDSPELTQIMAAMAAMVQNMQTSDATALRDGIMGTDYSGYILDTIDKNVFSPVLGEKGHSGGGDLPLESWKPAPIRVTSEPGQRSPEQLRNVIDQFDVENAARYEPFRNGNTYCNIFLWDVTRALGCEIPHYVDPATGEPMQYPNTKGAKELGAIATEKWLLEHGETYGWRQVDAETAQRYANEGKAAVTTAGSIGHVQVVCPSKDGEYDSVRGVTIAQAGRIVTNYTYLSGIYSANGRQNVKYFVHE